MMYETVLKLSVARGSGYVGLAVFARCISTIAMHVLMSSKAIIPAHLADHEGVIEAVSSFLRIWFAMTSEMDARAKMM